MLPGCTEEVARVVRFCQESALSLVPQGGNIGLVGGCFTEDTAASVILNTKRMNQVRALDVENYAVHVEAGCIIQTVQDKAADANRLFPVSFGAQGSATVGGAVATNAGGLNVLRYGMVRDLILGLEVVLPDRRVLDHNSGLRKDNRGPKLKQLFIGSEGCLGIVATATFKLFPLPRHRETAFLALGSVENGVALYTLAREVCTDLLSAFELIPQACVDLALSYQPSLRSPITKPHETYVLLDVAASGPLDLRALLGSLLETAMAEGLVRDGTRAETLAQSQAMWALREAMVEAQAARGRHLRTDISVPISALPAFIDAAHQAVAEAAPDWTAIAYGHIGDGNVHFNVLPPDGADDTKVRRAIPGLLDVIYGVLDRFDGSISAEQVIGRTRLPAFACRQGAAAQQLGLTMKALLDPRGTMNSGCLYPPLPLS